MMTPLLLQAHLEAMALKWSEFHLSAEATEKQKEKYKIMYLKQIGVKLSKRDAERSYKRRAQELYDDDDNDKPKEKAAKRPATSCGGCSSSGSSSMDLFYLVSRDKSAVRKCKKLIADLENELQRAKARLPDLEANLQRSEAEFAAARAEERCEEDEKPEADADQDGDASDNEVIDVTGGEEAEEQEDSPTEQQARMSQQVEHLSVEKVSLAAHDRYPVTATLPPLPRYRYRYPVTATATPQPLLNHRCPFLSTHFCLIVN